MMKNCQRCGEEAFAEDQKFCGTCGWNLAEEMPVAQELAKKPKVCPFCEAALPEDKFRLNVCPTCGRYIGFNASTLHPDLIEIALTWTGGRREFCTEVLGLSMRIARTLTGGRYAYATLEPIEVLALTTDLALSFRDFGDKSYTALNDARNNWQPK